MKERDYTLTIDVHVSKEETADAQRRYSFKIYGHPISEVKEPFSFELSNMRDEKARDLGKNVLHAIWKMVQEKDGEFWKG
jgi:hypothetical protein